MSLFYANHTRVTKTNKQNLLLKQNIFNCKKNMLKLDEGPFLKFNSTRLSMTDGNTSIKIRG